MASYYTDARMRAKASWLFMTISASSLDGARGRMARAFALRGGRPGTRFQPSLTSPARLRGRAGAGYPYGVNGTASKNILPYQN